MYISPNLWPQAHHCYCPGLLCNSNGVAQHAHSHLDLGQVSTRNHSGRLVVDANLEASGTLVHRVDGVLGIDGSKGSIEIYITLAQRAVSHELAMARVKLYYPIG